MSQSFDDLEGVETGLNEISGGCEKITLVSGSFCNILKLLRMMAFTG